MGDVQEKATVRARVHVRNFDQVTKNPVDRFNKAMGLWCSYVCIYDDIITLRHKYSYRKPCGKRQAHDAGPAAGLPSFSTPVINPSPLPRLMPLPSWPMPYSPLSLGPHQLTASCCRASSLPSHGVEIIDHVVAPHPFNSVSMLGSCDIKRLL